MTVIALDGPRFQVDVSRESLNLTVGLDREGEVNLEKSLRVGDQIGGHLVSGHVDGLGVVLRFDTVGESRSEEHTSELQSLMRISYAVFCLKKKQLIAHT